MGKLKNALFDVTNAWCRCIPASLPLVKLGYYCNAKKEVNCHYGENYVDRLLLTYCVDIFMVILVSSWRNVLRELLAFPKKTPSGLH